MYNAGEIDNENHFSGGSGGVIRPVTTATTLGGSFSTMNFKKNQAGDTSLSKSQYSSQ